MRPLERAAVAFPTGASNIPVLRAMSSTVRPPSAPSPAINTSISSAAMPSLTPNPTPSSAATDHAPCGALVSIAMAADEPLLVSAEES